MEHNYSESGDKINPQITQKATTGGISATEVRNRLRANGYLPVPVAHRDKRPLMKGWQTYVYNPAEPMPSHIFGIPHPSTGVRCSGIIAFDIDVSDETMRDDIRAIIEGVLGDSPAVRFRDRSTKLAMFYRPEPFFSTSGEGARFRIANKQKLELYGAGDLQILVHGEHADSTDDHPIYYRWEEEPLWDIPREDLPPVTVAQTKNIVAQVVYAYPPQDGAEASLRGESEPPQTCVRNILSAEDFHGSTVALAGHLAATGMPPDMVLAYIDWVYSAVSVRDMTSERQRDFWARRADIRRVVIDISRRELRKADSLYSQFITETALAALKPRKK